MTTSLSRSRVWVCSSCGHGIPISSNELWCWCTCGQFTVLRAADQPRPRVRTPWDRVAATAQAFEATQRAIWSSMWPIGHCAVSSLLLAPLLRCADEEGDWRVAVGVGVVAWTSNGGLAAEYEARWGYKAVTHRAPLRHAWCESAAGDVVDPTYGQFDLGDTLVALHAHEAGDLGHYASRILTLDEEDECRRSISPTRSADGYKGGATSLVKKMFEAVERGE